MTVAISREQAIKIVQNRCKRYTTVCVLAVTEIRNLPPIQPKRDRWIKLDMHIGMADHKCTACEQECYVPTCMGEPMYAFCQNCGCRMDGGE